MAMSITTLKGLIIKSPYIDYILLGEKTWEMRSRLTTVRGPIALIKKGSGMIVGIATIETSFGPLSREDLICNQGKHRLTLEELSNEVISKWNKVWVIGGVTSLERPVQYCHPRGATIWVNLDSKTTETVLENVYRAG
jgi:hypothetical protein